MGVARIFQRGGHTDSYIGYSPNCHLNIVGCLLTKRLTKGGGVTGTPGPPLATPLNGCISPNKGFFKGLNNWKYLSVREVSVLFCRFF